MPLIKFVKLICELCTVKPMKALCDAQKFISSDVDRTIRPEPDSVVYSAHCLTVVLIVDEACIVVQLQAVEFCSG